MCFDTWSFWSWWAAEGLRVLCSVGVVRGRSVRFGSGPLKASYSNRKVAGSQSRFWPILKRYRLLLSAGEADWICGGRDCLKGVLKFKRPTEICVQGKVLWSAGSVGKMQVTEVRLLHFVGLVRWGMGIIKEPLKRVSTWHAFVSQTPEAAPSRHNCPAVCLFQQFVLKSGENWGGTGPLFHDKQHGAPSQTFSELSYNCSGLLTALLNQAAVNTSSFCCLQHCLKCILVKSHPGQKQRLLGHHSLGTTVSTEVEHASTFRSHRNDNSTSTK